MQEESREIQDTSYHTIRLQSCGVERKKKKEKEKEKEEKKEAYILKMSKVQYIGEYNSKFSSTTPLRGVKPMSTRF